MPLQSGIASPAYYGLDAVPFAKLSHDVRQQRDKKQARRKTKVTSFQTDPDVITIRINRRLFNYVSTVAASVVLFFAFTSPFGNPVMPNEQQKAVSAITAPISPRPATTLEEKAPSISQPPSISPVKGEEKVASDSPVKVEEKVCSNSQAPSNSPYAIVLASAISKKSALSFADKLQQQGINALACEFGGMVRVIIPGFATQDDAYAEIRRLKTESKDIEHAWPCLLKEELTPLAL